MATTDELHTTPLQNPLVRLWRAPGLNRVFNMAVSYAPSFVQHWIERERTRVRQDDLKQQIESRHRLIPEPEFRALMSRGLQALTERAGGEPLGDYLEFGVYNGTSLTCVYHELSAHGLNHARLFGFDSFQGLPPDADQEDEGRWRPGSCCSSLEFTTAVLESEGLDMSRVTLVPGWFRDTLNANTVRRLGLRRASVIMVDCDLYSAAKEALNFSAPLMGEHMLLLFDEYRPWKLENTVAGERKAFEEFLAEQGCFEAEPFGSYTRRAEAFLVRRTA